MRVMDIVETQAGTTGVIIEVLGPQREFRVQLIDIEELDQYGGHKRYSAGFIGLYSPDQLGSLGYCENDHAQALILCAAAGLAFSNAGSYSIDA